MLAVIFPNLTVTLPGQGFSASECVRDGPPSCHEPPAWSLSASTSKSASASPALHLAALRDHDVQVGHVAPAAAGLGGLHLPDDVHAIDDLAEDDVLAVQEGRRHRRDEELRAVRVRAGVLGNVSFSLDSKSDLDGRKAAFSFLARKAEYLLPSRFEDQELAS